MIYYLNIGANVGNCEGNIRQAIKRIENECGVVTRKSDFVRSAPWGYASTHRFLNIGVAFESGIQPQQMLQTLRDIEQEVAPGTSHRTPQGGYADRAIDIDIIAIDSRVIHSATLQVPHPRMHLRDFCLQPMIELAPLWVHPKLGLTARQMLEKLNQ